MNVTQNKRGFTIIEVVLVLAIAALIFLMVFIALPALQRGQRDAARKNDASAVASAINTFKSNNNGKIPAAGGGGGGVPNFATFKNDYLTDQLSQYDVNKITSGTGADVAPASIDEMKVVLSRKCDNSVSSRTVAVVIRLEGADARYCVEA